MRTYSIMIDAQTNGGERDFIIYSEDSRVCKFSPRFTFYDWLRANFPLIQWRGGDGADFDEDEDTDFVQYVAYTDPYEKDFYVLAYFTFCDYEEEK